MKIREIFFTGIFFISGIQCLAMLDESDLQEQYGILHPEKTKIRDYRAVSSEESSMQTHVKKVSQRYLGIAQQDWKVNV
jgi:hypothetical protein